MLIQRSSKKLKNIANKWNRFSPRASPSPQLAKRLLRNAQRFVWKDPNTGALLGPLPAYLRAPKIYGHIMGLIMNLRTLALSSTVTEIVILVVASHFGAAYPLYAHEYQARAITDLTEAQVEALKAGRTPDGLSDQGLAAYEVARELLEKKGPLSKDRWDSAVNFFGMDGALGLLYYVGVYSAVSVLVNGIDTPVPDANWKM